MWVTFTTSYPFIVFFQLRNNSFFFLSYKYLIQHHVVVKLHLVSLHMQNPRLQKGNPTRDGWHHGDFILLTHLQSTVTTMWQTFLKKKTTTWLWSLLCGALFGATIFVLTLGQDLSSTADIPTPLFGFTPFPPPLFLPHCPKFLERKVLLNCQHRRRQFVHLSFLLYTECTRGLLLFVFPFFPQSFNSIREICRENHAANKVKADWR